MVQDQAAVLHVEQFHNRFPRADENKYVPLAQLMPHVVLNQSAKRVHSTTHVGLPRAQEVAHGVIKAEHGRRRFGPGAPLPSHTGRLP